MRQAAFAPFRELQLSSLELLAGRDQGQGSRDDVLDLRACSMADFEMALESILDSCGFMEQPNDTTAALSNVPATGLLAQQQIP